MLNEQNKSPQYTNGIHERKQHVIIAALINGTTETGRNEQNLVILPSLMIYLNEVESNSASDKMTQKVQEIGCSFVQRFASNLQLNACLPNISLTMNSNHSCKLKNHYSMCGKEASLINRVFSSTCLWLINWCKVSSSNRRQQYAMCTVLSWFPRQIWNLHHLCFSDRLHKESIPWFLQYTWGHNLFHILIIVSLWVLLRIRPMLPGKQTDPNLNVNKWPVELKWPLTSPWFTCNQRTKLSICDFLMHTENLRGVKRFHSLSLNFYKNISPSLTTILMLKLQLCRLTTLIICHINTFSLVI